MGDNPVGGVLHRLGGSRQGREGQEKEEGQESAHAPTATKNPPKTLFLQQIKHDDQNCFPLPGGASPRRRLVRIVDFLRHFEGIRR